MKAFPSTLEYIPDDRAYEQEDGMDLRDYFAAKAMQGIMSKEHYDGTYESVAMYAYKCADAMMEAREK